MGERVEVVRVLYFKIALQDGMRWKACRKLPPRPPFSATFSQVSPYWRIRTRGAWDPMRNLLVTLLSGLSKLFSSCLASLDRVCGRNLQTFNEFLSIASYWLPWGLQLALGYDNTDVFESDLKVINYGRAITRSVAALLRGLSRGLWRSP